MKVAVQTEHCICSGACVIECPEVFAQDDDGLVILLQSEPPEDLRPALEKAAASCPAAIIEIMK